MHLSDFLEKNPHLIPKFKNELGEGPINSIMELGKYYRLLTGYSPLVSQTWIPKEGDDFIIETQFDKSGEVLNIFLRKDNS